MTSQSTDAIQKSPQKETVGHALSPRSEWSFTPGPWKLCHHLQSPEKDVSCPCGYRGGIWGSDGEHIVCEMGSQPIPGQEGMEPPRYARSVELANARLIAAAPDLLGALKFILAFYEPGQRYLDTNAWKQAEASARAAVAKATLSTDASAAPTESLVPSSLNPSSSSKGGAS